MEERIKRLKEFDGMIVSLIFSTIITMVIVPVMYRIFSSKGERRKMREAIREFKFGIASFLESYKDFSLTFEMACFVTPNASERSS